MCAWPILSAALAPHVPHSHCCFGLSALLCALLVMRAVADAAAPLPGKQMHNFD